MWPMRQKVDKADPGERSILAYVQECYEKAAEERRPFERIWWVNLAFFSGDQWVMWNRVSNRLETPRAGDVMLPRKPVIWNYFKPIVLARHSKETRTTPYAEVQPATNEDSDAKAAKVGTKILEYMRNNLALEEKWDLAWRWAELTGTVFWKVIWNPNKGGKHILFDPISGEPLSEYTLGDVDLAVRGPFSIYPDPTGTDYYGDEGTPIAWLIEEYAEDIDVIYEKYGVRVEAEDVSEIKSNTQTTQLASAWQGQAKSEKLDHHAAVREMWVRPCANYPRGRLIICTSTKLLKVWTDEDGMEALPYWTPALDWQPQFEGEECPYEKRVYDLPYEVMVPFKKPGQFWGVTIAEDLVNPQRQLNITMSQILQESEGTSKIMAPKGLVDWSRVNTRDGLQVIEYDPTTTINPNLKPEFLNRPGVSVSHYRNIELFVQHMYQISGVHEISHGQAPPGVTSGRGLMFLAEQDDSKYGPPVRRGMKCYERVCSQILRRVRQGYKEPRVLRIIGKDGSVDIVPDFMGADLTSTDARVVIGEGLPQSKYFRAEWIERLVQIGALKPAENEKDRDMVLRVVELGGENEIQDQVTAAKYKQASENRRMAKGYPVEPKYWEDHPVHLDELNRFRNSLEYDEAVAWNPLVADLFEAHYHGHKALMAQVASESAVDQVMPQVTAEIAAQQMVQQSMPPPMPPLPPELLENPQVGAPAA